MKGVGIPELILTGAWYIYGGKEGSSLMERTFRLYIEVQC
jgi:hypothetical protein